MISAEIADAGVWLETIELRDILLMEISPTAVDDQVCLCGDVISYTKLFLKKFEW